MPVRGVSDVETLRDVDEVARRRVRGRGRARDQFAQAFVGVAR